MGGLINWITEAILRVCFGIKPLAVALVSMVPIVELKGGIPIGVKLGLSTWESFLWAFLGSSLVCIPLLLLLPLLFKWPFLRRVRDVFQEKADKVSPKWKVLGVFIFVAVPLPGTGVWTGSIVAVILGLRFWHSVGAIIAGNLIAGMAILGLTALLGEAGRDWLLLGLFIAFVLLLAAFLFKVFRKKDVTQNGP